MDNTEQELLSQAVDGTERELFEGALKDTPTNDAQVEDRFAPPAGDIPADGGSDQPRDEKGRFASRQPPEDRTPADTSAESGQRDDQRDGANVVPAWRLREVSEARREAERRAVEAERERDAIRQLIA